MATHLKFSIEIPFFSALSVFFKILRRGRSYKKKWGNHRKLTTFDL